METIICNLTGKVRKAQLSGREYLVAPVSLIAPGILNGSDGPILYLKEENDSSVFSWNNIPIVMDHPSNNGVPTSARTAEVLNDTAVGMVLAAKSNGKLTAEAWIDVEHARRIDSRIIPLLNQNKPFPVSTGLQMDRDPTSGTHDGQSFDSIARNYRPDHLAILLDKQPACSISDGCGINVNSEQDGDIQKENKESEMKLSEDKRTELVDGLIENCLCEFKEDDRETLNAFNDKKLESWTERNKKMHDRELVANAATANFEDEAGSKHVFNAETNKFETTVKEVEPEPEVVEVTNEETTEQAPQTTAEWMATAPAEIQSAVTNAIAIEQREKDAIIGRLTANAEDQASVFSDMTLNELKKLEFLAPQQDVETPVHNYMGASVPVDNHEDDYDRTPGLPTLSLMDAQKA